MFEQEIHFIGYPKSLCEPFGYDSPAPLFRKHFEIHSGLVSAKLTICALGLGKFYLNGKPLTDELFISPFSDYCKTLWCNEYDLTEALVAGDNLVAVALGNGFYNENLATGWDFDKAPWRDSPKFYFKLQLDYSDKTEFILSDTDWLCTRDSSPYRFNQFRMGEIFDYNYTTDWMRSDYDDSEWEKASILSKPNGTIRTCKAEPIKETSVFECKELFKNRYDEWVFDFGQNISGYIRLRTKQPKGTKLHIVYAEQLDSELRRKDNKLSGYYRDGETQFSTVITAENEIDWKPDFTYYGFRYVIISGFKTEPNESDIQALFVHQQLKSRGHFICSDEFLNKLYRAARISTLSNCFNMPTDCPTREKLGWCNDAQASCEQMIQNFDMTLFYEKWMQDIIDAQKSDGDLPGIVPTGGWGYEWGSGPVSTGILFEIPFRLYQYNRNSKMLCDSLSYMLKHIDFLDGKTNPDTGLIEHGLDDWAGPWPEGKGPVPLGFVCTVLYIRFCSIAQISAKLAGKPEIESTLQSKKDIAVSNFKKSFMNSDGSCKIEEQTAIALIIINNLYTDFTIIKNQLFKSVEKYDYHFHVGMLGMQYILPALDMCGFNNIGYRLLTAVGYPSYQSWFDMGATSLHEMFGDTMSCNHHMYSCVIAWFHNTILGIRHKISPDSETSLIIKPFFLQSLSYAVGTYKTDMEKVRIDWKRVSEDCIDICIDLETNREVTFEADGYSLENGTKKLLLINGRNNFILKKD